jgi:hypothetical protein
MSASRFSSGSEWPGSKKFTSPNAMPTPAAERKSVASKVRMPTRPSVRMSPISRVPSTIAERINGTTTMKMILKKIRPAGWIT